MGIFDRIGRMARSEVSELKRVLREGREDTGDPDESSYQRDIAAAEAELARGEGYDALSDEIEGRTPGTAAGTAGWGADEDELERGADLWAQPGEAAPVPEEQPMTHRDARVGSFSREIREAYAALELPLGADRAAIEASYRALTVRYHPDRHAQSPHLQQTATELTIRIREARDLLLAWLG